MAKRKKQPRRKSRLKSPVSSYPDVDGNVLVLRQVISRASVAKVREEMGNQAANVDDIWQRRTELLFERLAVSWEISGLALDDQKMLLGRFRMADPETKSWIRETIASHIEEFIPELES
ncbi:MAG: hypothetical protein WEB05_07630 [Solirubrobacterales bacterium]